MKRTRLLVLYAGSAENKTLSYQQGWPRVLADHPALDSTTVNVLDRISRSWIQVRRRRFDAIVLLHSVFSNSLLISEGLAGWLHRASEPKVFFIGNEYKLMPEKIAFCERICVDLLVSQLASAEAHAAYRERLGCAVVGMPNTGIDPTLFAPRIPRSERPIDLGYRAYPNPPYLGHAEREELAEVFLGAAERYGLRVDVSLNADGRFEEAAWADFLNSCKGQIGSEAGGDYFDLTDRVRRDVNDFLAVNPGASREEVFDRFFRGRPRLVSGRALSGRVVEAAATKTVQVLLEGSYGGFFEPDRHYIPLRKDFANLDEAIEKFRDETFCAALTDAAHTLALERFTYRRLVDDLRTALAPLL